MPVASRAADLARIAAGLAAGAGVELPSTLALWQLAGGRPQRVRPHTVADPAAALGLALERRLTASERQRGAHFSPAPLATRVGALAVPHVDPAEPPTLCDPACGAGSLLLAAADRLAAAGVPRSRIARDLIFGADVDPLAAAVTEAAITLWSSGTAPAPGHVLAADPLALGAGAWPRPPDGGFGAVVANPPFQGQLTRSTARSRDEAAALRKRYGDAVVGYVDTAALFLLLAVDLARPGARVAVVQPASVAAARDAAPVREALAERARLVELWAPAARLFAASVHVCVPVLEVGRRGRADWARLVARARGVPAVRFSGERRRVSDVARLVAGFRDEYYGLAPYVREADEIDPDGRLITSGAIDLGRCRWGERPVRFAKASWQRPVVDRAAASTGPAAGLLRRVHAPKVLIATQTRIIEVAVDEDGSWVPCTPVVSAVPDDPDAAWELAAALAAPPAVAWLFERSAGTALQPGALRPTAPLLSALPLPADRSAWLGAAESLRAGDLERFGALATEAHALTRATAARVLRWWTARLPTHDPEPDPDPEPNPDPGICVPQQPHAGRERTQIV